METFPQGYIADKGTVGSFGGLVVRPVSPQVSNTVHTPGTVQGEDIAKHRDKEIGNDQLFVPEIPRYQCGQDHLKQETEREVETVLKHYYWVNTTH